MRRSLAYSVVLPLLAACAGSPVPPGAPLTWPPGSYFLEGTVSYTGDLGSERETYSADLYVEVDGRTLRLDSHVGGVCQDPTLPQLERDRSRGVRTFRCGDVTFELRPGRETVTGDLSAVVQEAYEETTCLRYGSTGGCEETHTSVRTRPAVKRTGLRVRPL
jgi:hypothetical protein